MEKGAQQSLHLITVKEQHLYPQPGQTQVRHVYDTVHSLNTMTKIGEPSPEPVTCHVGDLQMLGIHGVSCIKKKKQEMISKWGEQKYFSTRGFYNFGKSSQWRKQAFEYFEKEQTVQLNNK